jgi:hypothetical protein
MNKIIFLAAIIVLSAGLVFSQDEPVYSPYESPYILDNQSTFVNYEKTLEMAIQHKFGTVENGITDIYGLYSSANIRIGFDYVPIKNLQIGYGLTRTEMTHDFNLKYVVFEQTQSNSKPFALAVYGNLGINGLEKEQLGANNAFPQRLSMFGQLLMSRKFGDYLTIQLGGSYSHFNMVDVDKYDYDRVAIHFSGRYKLAGTGAIVVNYDQPLDALRLTRDEQVDLNPNISFGYEFFTGTHDFQIYMGYTNHLLQQHAMVKENKEFEFEMFNIGFLITRLWAL